VAIRTVNLDVTGIVNSRRSTNAARRALDAYNGQKLSENWCDASNSLSSASSQQRWEQSLNDVGIV